MLKRGLLLPKPEDCGKDKSRLLFEQFNDISLLP